MKKVTASILAVLLSAGLSLSVFAAGSTTLTLKPSSSQIRIGDTVTVIGNFSGGVTIGTFDLNITYNAGQLRFDEAVGISPAIKTGEMDISDKGNGNVQLLYLDADGGNTGINGTDAFKLTFKVIGGNVGDAVKVDATIKTVGDSTGGGVSAGKNPATMTIAAPLSGNTFLSGLTVDNGTLAPVFNKNTTSYNISVPFSVSKLGVTATAEDSTSKVSVSSPELTAGGTTNVSVTVTAQSGAKKTYTIAVKREQDPNYKASSNNNLTSITIDKGILSPVFSKDKTAYVVWLPYEVESITASGTAEDSKATVTVEGGNALVAGQDNKVNVICKAEDGTKKEYMITVKRAVGFDGTTNIIQASSTTSIPQQGATAKGGISLLVFLLGIIVALGLGFGGGYILKTKRSSYRY